MEPGLARGCLLGTCRRVGTWDLKIVERDRNEGELGGRRGEVAGLRIDGALEAATGGRTCVNAKEDEALARRLPTNWGVVAGACGMW